MRWFRHGLRIFAGGFLAYLIAALAFSLPVQLIERTNLAVAWIGVGCAVVAIPVGIALFGYLFTKFYTHTTWGYEAAQDMKARDRPSLNAAKSIKSISR